MSSSLQVTTLAAVAVTSCGVSATATTTQDSKKKPNILFLMTDQQRFDTLGWSTRGHRSLTPNFDQLGSEGVIMKSSWSSTPICTPARAALLTGQNGWNNGMLGYMSSTNAHYDFTYPQGLSEAGYFTMSIGKNHFDKVPHGFQQQTLYDGLGMCDPASRDGHCNESTWDQEFDDYDAWFTEHHESDDPEKGLDDWNSWKAYPYPYEEYYHPTVWTTRNAVNFLSNYSSTAPLMLKVSWHRPHSPYDPPQRVLDTVLEADLPPLIRGGNWDGWYKKCHVPEDAWCGEPPAEELTLTRRSYLANIVLVDEGVGQVINTLKEQNIYEDTWILFSSDHGDGQSDHYHFRKGFPYEFSTHVGMIVRWPENYKEDAGVTLERGSFMDSSICTEMRDIAHTFLDIGGALDTVPSGRFTARDGKSILCLLRDPTGKTCDYSINPGPWREYMDMELAEIVGEKWHFWSALTDGKMKYIFWPSPDIPASFNSEQLFNLTADPGEMMDVSGEAAYADTLAMWRQRLVQLWTEQNRGDEWVKNGVLQHRNKSSNTNLNWGKD